MAARTPGLRLPGRSRPFAPALAIVLVLLVLAGVFVSLYTDLLWYREAGHSEVFSTMLGTKVLLFVLFALFMGAVVGANLVIAYRLRPPFRPLSLEQQNLEQYRVALERFLTPATIGLSALFGLFAGLSASARWKTWLLWRNGQHFGINDPQFHRDISYFTFTYPFQRFVLGFVLAALVIALFAAAITHYLFGGVRLQGTAERVSVGARVHLSVLIGLVVLAKSFSYWLDRYGLAFSPRGVVEGASYTDVHAVLPAKTMLTGIAVICALLFFANLFVRNVLLPAGALALLVVSALLIGGIYPAYVQQFQVKPNEVDRESPYIARNITATRAAYGIDGATLQNYPAVATATKAALRGDAGTLPNARLLDPNILGPTFRNYQSIRNYFGFNTSLDIDRYALQGHTQDYIVAMRELEEQQLRPDQRNWINLHLTYTHGNGFVAAPANHVARGGLPDFTVKNIPPVGPGGEFLIGHPQVYYGEASPSYSIVDTKQPEIDGPGGNSTDEATIHYEGPGGITLDSGFRKLLFALKFREKNILLSSALTSDSKIMYIRRPVDRIKKVAPFLTLDNDPYPAVVNGELLWVVDGYTTSSGYPYSERTELGEATTDSRGLPVQNERANYIRNSVKATVDAYTGKVRLYTWDDKDPILRTWKKVFPGLLLDRSAMSPELLKHVRYPEDLFKLQRQLLGAYHVTNPRSFYNKEDFWEVPADPTADVERVINGIVQPGAIDTKGADQPPYYVLIQMPGQTAPTFSLTSTFVARSRANLTAFAAVSSDPSDYGTIRVLQMPKATAIAGPGQVANSFESNSDFNRSIALFRTGASKAVLGNLLTLPVGGGLLYIEPVYTQAKKDTGFPVLNSVIVSFGDQVAFRPTLAAALDALLGTGTTTSTPPGTTTPPTTSDAEALAEVRAAADEMDKALREGDFAKFGVAYDRLKAALARVSPAPSPSPSGR